MLIMALSHTVLQPLFIFVSGNTDMVFYILRWSRNKQDKYIKGNKQGT